MKSFVAMYALVASIFACAFWIDVGPKADTAGKVIGVVLIGAVVGTVWPLPVAFALSEYMNSTKTNMKCAPQ